MASGLLFDPMVLLRLAPVITSTATLTFAHDQDLFLKPFTLDAHQQKANSYLPDWIKPYMDRALWLIVTFYPATSILALANIYTGDPGKAKNFYWAGLAFTIGHFVYGKKAIRLLNAIKSDESKGNSTKDLKAWLDNNTLRSFSVDLPGWASFVTAAILTLRV